MGNKKLWFWIASLILVFSAIAWVLFAGCSTSVQEEIATTTTTSGGGTTTTTAPTSGISGTVSWTWSGTPENGTLFVALWTNGDFSNRDLLALDNSQPALKKYTLTSGQTSASFSFTSPGDPVKGTTPTPGKYYLIGLLYVGRDAQMFDDPAPGDKVGQFSDGKAPIIFGGTTNPEAINYSGTAITGKNFSLNATFSGSTTTTSTITTTFPTTTTTLPPFTDNVYLASLSFLNQNQGWAGGQKMSNGNVVVYKTTDGGTNWSSYETGVPISNLLAYDLDFIDSNAGWMVGESELIMKTTDGGANWTYQHSNEASVHGSFYGVDFVNSSVGWVVGSIYDPMGGLIPSVLHTTNGGTNWATQDAKEAADQDVCFIDENRGWAVGQGGTLIRTINGGASWETVTISGIDSPFFPNNPPFNAVFFVDQNHGWIVGWQGVLLQTTDGGTTWSQQSSGVTNELRDIFFIDSNTGWVVGDWGVMLKTTNGGASWSPQTSGSPWPLWKVQFVSSSVGWAVGGVLLKTTNGGTTWNKVTLP